MALDGRSTQMAACTLDSGKITNKMDKAISKPQMETFMMETSRMASLTAWARKSWPMVVNLSEILSKA